jgi:hypothetical protein
MHAHARALQISAPILPLSAPARPRTPRARHAKTGDSADEGQADVSRPPPASPDPENEFDFTRPFQVDIGRAAVIAEYLRGSGYSRCTADVVIAELARPEHERSAIGRFAAEQLWRAGWRPLAFRTDQEHALTGR